MWGDVTVLVATTRFYSIEPRLDDLFADFASADVQPLWLQERLLPVQPDGLTPHIWRGKRIRDLAERAGELVGMDSGGDRRVLALSHPDLGGLPFATPTLWAAVQHLKAGEQAPAHRHSPAALRFVTEGAGVWTLVNGDPVHMAAGDLVLTPSSCWHEHYNPGDQSMTWFDGLDLPLVRNLDAMFFEPGSRSVTGYEKPSKSESERRYAVAGLMPIDPVVGQIEQQSREMYSPLLAYRWSRTDRQLKDLLSSRSGAAILRFTDPTSGRDVMPTLRAEILRMTAGHRTPTTRSVGSSVCLVRCGEGASVIDGVRYRWNAGDIFVIPSWSSVDHEAHDDADIFVMSDAPVMEALGLSRSEILAEGQEVTKDAVD